LLARFNAMRRAAVVLLVLASLAAATGSTATASSSIRYGIQDDAWLEFGPGTLASRVATLKRLGVDVVRVTLQWDEIETNRDEYNWRWPDRVLRALRGAGLTPIVTLWGTPSWANGEGLPNEPPRRGADFGGFAETIASRYPFVRDWTIWNEPNQARWLNPVSPSAYVTKLLNPAYRAIKSVNPSAKVAGGVTAPRGNMAGMSPLNFLLGMRSAGAQLDAYAHNPYPETPAETPLDGACMRCTTVTMASLGKLVTAVGKAFPRARIWLTEYGYQTDPPDPFGVSPTLQARYLAQAAYRAYTLPKVDLLIQYLYRDEPDLARWQSGLETVTGRAKPSMQAMMLPLTQVSRHGSTTEVWGQVRPGTGPQRYILQHLVAGGWVALGGTETTSARGYLVRKVTAPRGTKLRLWYPARSVASPALVVR
jgi:hypothetical protein